MATRINRERSYADVYPPELLPFMPPRIPVFVPGFGTGRITGFQKHNETGQILIYDVTNEAGTTIALKRPQILMVLN